MQSATSLFDQVEAIFGSKNLNSKFLNSVSDDAMKSPILEQIADGLNKLGRRGSTLLKGIWDNLSFLIF